MAVKQMMKTMLEIYDDDPELPLLARMDHGYPVYSLIQSLLASDVQEWCM